VSRDLVSSVESEFQRYKTLAEGAMEQVGDAALSAPGPGDQNSIAIIVWHISGNLTSRFTDFLTTDGEKPWRHRDEEFDRREVSRAELNDKWARGWSVALAAIRSLTDADLSRVVHIRAQPVPVADALHRALAHVSYHVGQIVLLARASRGATWRYLSIPPGQSDAFNKAAAAGRPAPPGPPKTGVT
jgi:predicted DCC family thiol-disulfide oxidoreductase YuxK